MPTSRPATQRSTTRPTTQATTRKILNSENEPFTVGFIYSGTKDDFGFNHSFAEGAARIAKMPGVTVVEAEKVAPNNDCEAAMESMISHRGVKLIVATAFAYFPFVKKLAALHPDVEFLHAGGFWKDGDPSTFGTFFAYIDEADYLCGAVSGLTTKSNKLGYVAPRPLPAVLVDINAFELGARSVNPKATTTVIFTGNWFDPSSEAKAVNDMAHQGIDVVTGHVDSPKALIQTAEKLGIYSCGYHADGTQLAPKGYLTGAQWNWGDLCVKFVNDLRADKPAPRNYMGSLRDGTVKLSPYGPAVTAETKRIVAPLLNAMNQGKFQIFKGPLKDNNGAIVISDGKSLHDDEDALWGMNYLVEGVIGSIH